MNRIIKLAGEFSLFGVITLISFSFIFAQDVVYTASELAKLRDAYWQSISSIDMEYTEEFIYKGEKRVDLPANRWSMDGKRERLIYHGLFQETAYSGTEPKPSNSPRKKEGDLFYREDMYFSGDTFYSMELQRNKIEEVINIPKFESILDFQNSRLYVDMYGMKTVSYESDCPADWWLLFRRFVVSFGTIFERHTFEYFVSNKCRATSPVYSKNKDGDAIWTFTLHPKLGNDKKFVEIVINESKGFFLERVSSHTFEGTKKVDGKIVTGVELVVDFIVKEYSKMEDGRFFPKVVIYQYYPGGANPEDGYKNTYHVNRVSINKPIADSVFDFRIPEHTVVLHQPPVEKNGEKFFIESIWGPDNKPAITFTEPDALNDYLNEKYKPVAPTIRHPLPPMGIFSYWRIVFCAAGVIFLVVSILLAIRKNKIRHDK
ncbi:MAG: hypothetical protein LBH59_07795 [Planctomycetaceae bacterium]|jgi:hypothetical protein|nr:hypothetical protein [Planctomycetaceae bacterium]